MADEAAMTWLMLRERRSSLHGRSKLEKSAGRRQTFAAAMAQFEEQFTAAKVVTEFTRPLNLYYGLAQAGLAIAAAHAADPWSFSRHGLKLDNRGAGLADMTVGPDSDGGFQRVAAATGSPIIEKPASLGALWASLPEFSGTRTLAGSTSPEPIELLAKEPMATRLQATVYLSADMPADSDAWLARFSEIMSDYPAAAGWAIPQTADAINPPPPGEDGRFP